MFITFSTQENFPLADNKVYLILSFYVYSGTVFKYYLQLCPHSDLCTFTPGCFSDTEADSDFRMTDNKDNVSYRRSVSITPKASTPFNQFLPTKDKSTGYVPAPLRRKRAERNEDNRRSSANYTYMEDEGTLTRYC